MTCSNTKLQYFLTYESVPHMLGLPARKIIPMQGLYLHSTERQWQASVPSVWCGPMTPASKRSRATH